MTILQSRRSSIEFFLDLRLLFKMRELTQSQTQLQNQIERMSESHFDKGAMVIPGEIGYDLKYYAVKLTSKSASSVDTIWHYINRWHFRCYC